MRWVRSDNLMLDWHDCLMVDRDFVRQHDGVVWRHDFVVWRHDCVVSWLDMTNMVSWSFMMWSSSMSWDIGSVMSW